MHSAEYAISSDEEVKAGVKHTWKIWKHDTMCRNLVTEKMHFSKEKKKSESKSD